MAVGDRMGAIKIRVNGEPREVEEGLSVAELLDHLGIGQEGVAVAVNESVVRRADLPTRFLSAEDAVEIIRAVGGG